MENFDNWLQKTSKTEGILISQLKTASSALGDIVLMLRDAGYPPRAREKIRNAVGLIWETEDAIRDVIASIQKDIRDAIAKREIPPEED